MSVVTGSATDATDLLTQLSQALTNWGWTIDRFDASGNGKRLSVHKGAAYVSLRSVLNEAPVGGAPCYGIIACAHTTFDNNQDWTNQPGAVQQQWGAHLYVGLSVAGAGGIASFWIFGDAAGDNVWLVVPRAAGVVGYLGFGVGLANIAGQNVGAWPWVSGVHTPNGMATADYYEGSGQGLTSPSWAPGWHGNGGRAATFLYGTVDSYTGWVAIQDNQDGSCPGRAGVSSVANYWESSQQQSVPNYLGGFQFRSPKAVNSGVVLLPLRLYVPRDVGGYSLIGELPVVAAAFAPNTALGTPITIGTDTWSVFGTFAAKN